MILIASQLSAGFDFVRVDLYNVDGKIYFGEFTPTPAGCAQSYGPGSWDVVREEMEYVLGELKEQNSGVSYFFP